MHSYSETDYAARSTTQSQEPKLIQVCVCHRADDINHSTATADGPRSAEVNPAAERTTSVAA